MNNLTMHGRFIVISKTLSLLLMILTFWLPVNTIWFILTLSLLIGNVYYFMAETQPQLMMIFGMLLRHELTLIKRKINNVTNAVLEVLFASQVKLEYEDNFNSLCYTDSRSTKPKNYIYLFNDSLRSNDIIIFKDENNTDITEKIEPYLGPLQDFHGVPLTPGDFNHKKLTVYREGKINLYKSYGENEPMQINN